MDVSLRRYLTLGALSALVLPAAQQTLVAQPKSPPPPRNSAGAPPAVTGGGAANAGKGVTVSYQLPVDGPLPRTYRVTLAICDAKNPDWIVSTFAAGVVREVTAANGGKFTETWDGLDENFMPVPAGQYAVKGIYMPAEKWAIDGEYHTIMPQYVSSPAFSSPPAAVPQLPEPFGGDPVGAPLADIDVGPNGVAVFYYRYMENGANNPMFDLKKPVGYSQFLRSYPSGGAAGGECVTTDGETIWAQSTDGGPKFVYRADGASFGSSPLANRNNSYVPDGWVTAMANWKNAAGKPVVAIAQRGKTFPLTPKRFRESPDEMVNKITFHDGGNGSILGELSIARPQAMAVCNGRLYVLHAAGTSTQANTISSVALSEGVPKGNWKTEFTLPDNITVADMVMDSRGRYYVSDTRANKVYQLDPTGKITVTYGRLAAQVPGTYDPNTLMAPAKLATWKDEAGKDRLLIVEAAGPNRASEWDDAGRRLRDFQSMQTKSNDGYTHDPDNPEMVYVPGHMDWLTRFKVDNEKGTWTVDAVWPNVGTDPLLPGIKKPIFIRHQGREYLASARTYNIYRLDGQNGWKLSAGLVRLPRQGNGPQRYGFWSDTNNNGKVDEEEIKESAFPPGILLYHGQNWTEGITLVGAPKGGREVWRLAPSSFDAHGNPVFTSWEKLFADPIFAAKLAGTAGAAHGGNELDTQFTSDWSQVDGSAREGYYVQARGGPGFDANSSSQYKISRYVPGPDGTYTLKWRVGRAALRGVAQEGEMYGAMRINRPINGLLTIVDQTRMGMLLYTDEGLYVDTLFPDVRRFNKTQVGIYTQGGEFFAGSVFPDKNNGKIYLALGKYSPIIYEARGWSLKENPVRRLSTVQPTVTIASNQISAPPEIALTLRGGASGARLARLAPALGGAALDGSLDGWTGAEPIKFEAAKNQTVEVRTLYDQDRIYLRWHARLGRKFEARPTPALERIFAHDTGAETFSFYVQGDPAAPPPGKSTNGRPGDVRFVFGLFKEGQNLKPRVVGFYPEWTGTGKGAPQNYRTPVADASFAHVGEIPGAELGYALDEDGQGFVLSASIPRTAIPRQEKPFTGGLATQVNFDANFGGHNKFWWANSDGSASKETNDEPTEARLYPGSWAPAQWLGLEHGVLVRNWQIVGPFGAPGMENFGWNLNGVIPGTKQQKKDAVRAILEAAQYPPDNGVVDTSQEFTGQMLQGWWPKVNSARWRPGVMADLDTRVTMGTTGQVWYGATWIKAPAPTTVDFVFQNHTQSYTRWMLNGTQLKLGKEEVGGHTLRTVRQKVTLQPGWNQVMFRGFCVAYNPFRLGLVVEGPEPTLWSLSFTGTPPAQLVPQASPKAP